MLKKEQAYVICVDLAVTSLFLSLSLSLFFLHSLLHCLQTTLLAAPIFLPPSPSLSSGRIRARLLTRRPGQWVRASIYLSIYLSISLSIYLSLSLALDLSLSLPIYLSNSNLSLSLPNILLDAYHGGRLDENGQPFACIVIIRRTPCCYQGCQLQTRGVELREIGRKREKAREKERERGRERESERAREKQLVSARKKVQGGKR